MANATAQRVSEVLGAQGLKTIGALVFWTLSGVRIPRAELKEALEALGLGAAMVRQPTAATALAEAVKRTGMGRKGLIFRPMKRDWALVVERGEGKTLRMSHVATFKVGADERVEVEELARFDELSNLRLAIGAQYEEARDYAHSSDMSAVLCAALQGVGSSMMLGGLSLRQGAGGLYYVSAAKLDTMRSLAAMVHEKAPGCSVEVMTLTGDADNLEAAARNVRGNITTQLRETRQEIQAFVAELKDKGRSARGDSITTRAEVFRQLQGRVELFSDVLGDTMGELKAQVEAARVELMTELERV